MDFRLRQFSGETEKLPLALRAWVIFGLVLGAWALTLWLLRMII